MFEIGRICMKTAGREAGRFCVVVGKDNKDKDFLVITGPKAITHVRRRKCNYRHLEPTPLKLDIKENATDEQVLEAYDKEEIYAKLKITKPGAEGVVEERKEKHKEERVEEKHEPAKEHKEEKHEKKKAKKREAKPKAKAKKTSKKKA